MSVLRKRGKEKLRFKIMNMRVTNKDFNYLKRLLIECLKENADIEKQLNSNYKRIQVYFFYEQTDLNVETTLKDFLKDPSITHSPSSSPAFTQSRKGLGCIMFFLRHLKESTEKRKDVKNVEAYHKNGIFEELCHLVEQKGDSSIHPESYWTVWRLYKFAGKQSLGNEIIARLDTDRNHYEVYHMMIKAYPKEWIERYWSYFEEDPVAYEKNYEEWKQRLPIDIAYARLITDCLRVRAVSHVAEKVPRQSLSNGQAKSLDNMIKTGKLILEKKKTLIERDMGSHALDLIISLDESVFKISDAFFYSILDLWRRLRLA